MVVCGKRYRLPIVAATLHGYCDVDERQWHKIKCVGYFGLIINITKRGEVTTRAKKGQADGVQANQITKRELRARAIETKSKREQKDAISNTYLITNINHSGTATLNLMTNTNIYKLVLTISSKTPKKKQAMLTRCHSNFSPPGLRETVTWWPRLLRWDQSGQGDHTLDFA